MNFSKLLTAQSFLFSLISGGCARAQITQDPGIESLSATKKIFHFESEANGFNTKNFFYDNGEEVVVFDTQFTPELAKESIEFIRTQTQSPITHVILTHPNPDKFNGVSEFQALGAKVTASEATLENLKGVHDYKKYYFVNIAKMFSEETYPLLPRVETVFEKKTEIRLRNGERIYLSVLTTPGVSSTQTIAYIPSQNALFVGDMVHYQTHAWLEGGIVDGKPNPTIQGWISGLKEIQSIFKVQNPTVYGGRGHAVKLELAVKSQIQYLKKAEGLVTAYVKSLGNRKSELQTDQAGQHYLALMKIFEKEFPEYTLSYLIQYGIYGLVNSKLSDQ